MHAVEGSVSRVVRLLLVVAVAVTSACLPRDRRAAVAPSALRFDEPREAGRRYRSECTETRDAPPADTGTIGLSVVAEDEQTSAVLWRRSLASIWGRYGLADCRVLDGLWLASPVSGPHGARSLVARTTDGAWFFLDPHDGKSLREATWAKLGELGVLPNALTLPRVERTAVSSEPNYGFRIRARNAGPPLLVERSYPRFVIEAEQGGGRWRSVADEPGADDPLQVIAHGADLEVFVSAYTAASLRRAGDPLRLSFVVYPLRNDGLPTAPAMVWVTLGPEEVAVLTKR